MIVCIHVMEIFKSMITGAPACDLWYMYISVEKWLLI